MERTELLQQIKQLQVADWIKLLADVTGEKANLELQIEMNRHKVDHYDAVMDVEDLTEMSAAAKVLNFKGMGRNNLFAYLRRKGFLRPNNEPYQEYIDNRLFETKEQVFSNKGTGETWVNYKTHVTQKGIDHIRRLLIEDGHERNQDTER